MENPKVYIAARWADGATAQEVKETFAQHGVECTSTWLKTWCADEPRLLPDQQAEVARHDLSDIARADAFFLLANHAGAPERGGRIAEMGAAIVLSIPIYVLGAEHNPNVFHSLCIAVQSVTEVVPRLKSAPDFRGASR